MREKIVLTTITEKEQREEKKEKDPLHSFSCKSKNSRLLSWMLNGMTTIYPSQREENLFFLKVMTFYWNTKSQLIII